MSATRISTSESSKASAAGGWRERYAIDHGKAIQTEEGGHKVIRWYYDHNDPYQDANGAMWDVTEQRWRY